MKKGIIILILGFVLTSCCMYRDIDGILRISAFPAEEIINTEGQ